MGIGPDDTITFGKQQGTWIPTSGIHMVERGKFYGYVPSSHTKIQPTEFESPLCWIPHGIDNSCGGQVWAPPGDRWGPLGGNLLHFSYGKCQMFLVLHEEIDNIHQGGVIRIPGVQFESGAMRGRFRSQDGQLYVSGLRGWQTTATMPGCLQRVRYTGQPSYLPSALRIESKGIRISFNHPLDPATTENPSRYSIAQWNYRWTKNYGSPDFKVSNPEEQGRDRISVDRVALSEDGKSVLIEIPELQPAMQMEIRYRLQTMDGAPVEGAIYNTIHRVP